MRSAVAERTVSVGSDSETLGRTGCQREKAARRCEFRLLGNDYRMRHCDQGCRDKLSIGETEGCTRPSTLTRAVAATRGGPVMRTTRMFGACMMLRHHTTGIGVTRRFSRAMHRTGYNWSRRATQRRKPGGQQNDDQVKGEKAAGHNRQFMLKAKCLSGPLSQGESTNRRSARLPQIAGGGQTLTRSAAVAAHVENCTLQS